MSASEHHSSGGAATTTGASTSGGSMSESRGALTSGASALVSTLKDLSSSTIKDAFNGLRIGVARAARGDPQEANGDRGLVSPPPPYMLEGMSSQQTSDQQHRVARFVKLLDEAVAGWTVSKQHREVLGVLEVLGVWQLLQEGAMVDLDALRKLAWGGIPPEVRPECWRLLLGYMPPAKSRQSSTLSRKRTEYQDMVPQFYDIPASERSEEEAAALRQVQVDVPRTAPTVPLFQEPPVQKSLERLLYIWGTRHPASGYVQGMNDLVTPFLIVFLGEHLPGPLDRWQPEQLEQIGEDVLLSVEADCYWCLCKLVEGIQDHYTYAQPGIQRAVFKIQELVTARDAALADKLESEHVNFIQFAWRWVNCLLLRELPLALAPRLWDNYLVEGTGMCDFLLLLCAEFLLLWRGELMAMEFQEIIMFLQRPPTTEWTDKELVQLLSHASYHTIDKSRMMKNENKIEL